MASLVDLDGAQHESLKFEVLHPSEWKRVRRDLVKHLSNRHGWSCEQIAKVVGQSDELVRLILCGRRT